MTTIVGVLILAAGCGSRLNPPGGLAGAPAAPAAVERFLQLARDKDYTGMGWIFGTAEGPVLRLYPRPEVEQRMYALASVLEHDSFVVGPGDPVPGRSGAALQFSVSLRRGFQTSSVPFTVVRGPAGRWYVEQLDVEALTGG